MIRITVAGTHIPGIEISPKLFFIFIVIIDIGIIWMVYEIAAASPSSEPIVCSQ
jgi:hypothetical protein